MKPVDQLRALLAEHIDQWDTDRQPVFLAPVHRGIADKPRDDYSRPANMGDSVVRYRWEPCDVVIGRETFKGRRLLANAWSSRRGYWKAASGSDAPPSRGSASKAKEVEMVAIEITQRRKYRKTIEVDFPAFRKHEANNDYGDWEALTLYRLDADGTMWEVCRETKNRGSKNETVSYEFERSTVALAEYGDWLECKDITFFVRMAKRDEFEALVKEASAALGAFPRVESEEGLKS